VILNRPDLQGDAVTSDRLAQDGTSDRPLISVIMANYQGGRYIERAIDSVLAQTVTDLEVIVSDDASSDDSIIKAAARQAKDPRVRLVLADKNGGPARCRNRALDAARGQWIAIVDSDDLIHPERFERLLAAAKHAAVEIVADDLLHFHEDGSPSRLLLPDDQQAPLEIGPSDWILAGERGTPPLGYIQPMISASLLQGLRYDETLRIGEDYDLVLRLLLGGARLLVVPEPWYFYRRHDRSFSYRSSIRDLEAMIDSQRRFMAADGPFEPEVTAAFKRRLRNLRGAIAFEQLVAAIKQRNFGGVANTIAQHPKALLRLARSARERASRTAAIPTAVTTGPELVVLSDGNFTASSGMDNALTIRVPPYDAPQSPRWGGAVRRKTWRQIADLSRVARPRLVFDGRAGAYAAGFMP
jgi:succinoglycan biosynthesis protein ExoO